jgi:hypothetical protein
MEPDNLDNKEEGTSSIPTTENQGKNNTSRKKGGVANLAPFQWKKGQSGNPNGRPKGKTMKEYARLLLERQTEEERQEFLHGLPKEIIWKMAEGNPKQDLEHKGEVVSKIISIDE